jgi:hypothetical protein
VNSWRGCFCEALLLVTQAFRELTKNEYLKAIAKPRRRFQVLALGTSGTVRLGKAVAPPCYWFERNELGEERGTGRYLRIPSLATISLVVDGKTSALFYLVGRRLDTCTFAYDLTPAQLGKAVAAMKRAKLTRLILPAASWALEHLPDPRRAVLEPELRKLVASRRQGRKSSIKSRRGFV